MIPKTKETERSNSLEEELEKVQEDLRKTKTKLEMTEKNLAGRTTLVNAKIREISLLTSQLKRKEDELAKSWL